MVREAFTWKASSRVPEPDLVMDDPEKVDAYVKAGRNGGVMTPVYLYHATQICSVIQPGDLVIDLACGPANQLGLVAELNPDTRFLGIDLSAPMLQRAKDHIDELQLDNVELLESDIADLSNLSDNSVDAVISTMALHHLPTVDHLLKTFEETKRVLKSGGGVYLADFAHLKSDKAIDYFAHQYKNQQPELFTLDYLYSLRAAFSKQDFRQAVERLGGLARLYSPIFPFMISVKSEARRPADPALDAKLLERYKAMPRNQQVDYKDLSMMFRLGGLKL